MSLKKRLLITVLGSVQGVGFRPFVYRLAHKYSLVGHIKNTNRGVDIDVQGGFKTLIDFQEDLVINKPERALIVEVNVVEVPLLNETKDFEITSSESTSKVTLALLPDSAMCFDCLQELSDPNNRRYRYPFLHCMTCGPRFSLFLRMPFDRDNTTMTDFSMCDHCQKEYADPSDRRFYSQTNCCPACGPILRIVDYEQKLLGKSEEAIDIAAQYLRQGKIVAVKNTGGFLLLVDATNEKAVNQLRFLKQRAKKPFAMLTPDLSYAKQIAYVDQAAFQILTSPAAPIVLLPKISGDHGIAPSVALESPYYGLMLPHNPLQYLLLEAVKRPLVATSGNISGRALCVTEEEAFSQLSPFVDAYLVHNRRIMHRLDDSVVQIIKGSSMVIRRARGYIPYAINIKEALQSVSCILGTGGHLKNSFAFSEDQTIYMSQHIGNLDSMDVCNGYDQEVKSFEKLLNITPSIGVCDKHPDYYTSHYLQKRNIEAHPIQHHEAHVYSGMLDNGLLAPLLSFSWDGTGLSDDQSIGGGEAFIVQEEGIQHFASLYPFRLPGAEKAIKEPRRSLLGLLHAIFGSKIPSFYQTWIENAFTQEERNILLTALDKKINAPLCSSIGRLFDGVSALLDCCLISHFEGHAALKLESLALKGENPPHYDMNLVKEKKIWLLDWKPMIKQMFEDKMRGIAIEEIGLAFHKALARAIVELSHKASLENVLLTGGVMQNRLLMEDAIDLLRQSGFKPFWHHHIPPNDGGLAVGQIMAKLHCM